ncbi:MULTISPECIES: cell division protein FtsQ/DivIB [Flavobacterium]|uniref:Cell division protein FtsQ n=2 Tax=Flavobacterium TaxID=237 RepID=A0A940X5E8_9FLAO|nr:MULTISPECIES: cell division protein FtsQ [Flavobacterium]MBP4136684.1 cell division protein FtsQ [Flavobacterium geliluteum]MDX6183805.1 cell division protein FtsQ [Flavobacterium sp. Fl-33]MDX6187451.1 cell division protein FtsQ [Flavobacterium sp. Fl-77]UFH40353.1 cell division protein FtsQ [Flavobacterium sp. F-70]
MKLFNWTNIRLLLIFGLVLFLYSFAQHRNGDRKLKKSTVVFVGENTIFVTPETVNKLLIENKRDASSIRKDEVDLNKIEKTLDTQEMIEKSDVFVSIDGVLKAVVKQKTPVARFFDGQRSFYIDYKGGRMPLSDNFTARVPLVSGTINEKNNEDLATLFRLIYDDVFLKKNIIAIQIMPNGSLKMFNRNYNYFIDFGRTINVERKFENYKAFFQKAVLDSSLYKYKKIDLRFTEQVVCTK